MGLKTFKPYTPSRRHMILSDYSDITKTEPEKSLIIPLKKKGGRDNTGRIAVRHRGGGHKRYYRIIDFKRDKFNVKAKVIAIEYDPNRSARIALLQYEDGEKRYIIAPLGLNVGDEVMSGENVDIKIGNAMKLKYIPEGTMIHNIELTPSKGGVLCRSAGTWAQLLSKDDEYAHVKLPSGEVRLIPLDCMATIGQVSNPDHEGIVLGKAGKKKHLGIRPTTRGVAMRPVDHPHGGGKGKGKGGNIPRSYSGVVKGKKTRRKKIWDKLIITRRK